MSKGSYNKLFIIGNGFDRWQGLPTSYDQFKEYYRKNISDIAKALNVKTNVLADGSIITPVEKVFGDITKPTEMPDEFFWNFETSMALLDDQELINYFDKTNKGVFELQELVENALSILEKAFGDWIHSITIDSKPSGYLFGDGCFFINFNYTETLEC